MSHTTHNLDIHTYSFAELLQLFDLSHTISVEDMKRAKSKVLRMHPDKSQLSPDYYIFYKKAYDIVKQYYEDANKVTKDVTKQAYQADIEDDTPDTLKDQMRKFAGTKDFNARFNEMFERNVAKKADPEENSWFKDEANDYANISVKSKDDLANQFNQIRQKGAALVKYDGFREMVVGRGTGLYGDGGGYKTSDPFSKLQYDDLRKVYKDQPLLTVSERDYEEMQNTGKIFKTMEECKAARETMDLKPMDRLNGEALLKQQQDEFIKRMSEKKYLSDREAAATQQKIQSAFLHIK